MPGVHVHSVKNDVLEGELLSISVSDKQRSDSLRPVS